MDKSCIACSIERVADLLFSREQHTCDDEGSPEEGRSRYTLDNYQDDAGITAIYPGRDDPKIANSLTYLILKLNGEAGEAAEHLGKFLRGDYDEDKFRGLITKEIGDVLWYLSQIAYELATPLSTIAAGNIRKLLDRSARGKISGSGDDR